MTDDVSTDKARLRAEQKRRFAAIADVEKRRQEAEICARLHNLWNPAARPWVLGFVALPDEPALDAFWNTVLDAGRLAMPRLDGDQIVFHRVATLGGWLVHPWGLREPAPDLPPWSAADAEWTLVLVPGLAFDATGGRLGRGKGFYDRFLTRAGRVLAWGVGWRESLVETVPRSNRDRLLDAWVGPDAAPLAL